MSQEELLAAMELDAPVLNSAPVTEIITGGDEPAKVVPKSETVLDLDKWSLRRGQEMLESSPDLREVVKLAQDLADVAAGAAGSVIRNGQ
jgi:hypothetical protein